MEKNAGFKKQLGRRRGPSVARVGAQVAAVGRKEAVTAARHQHHHIIIPVTVATAAVAVVAAAAAPPPVCEVRPMFIVGTKAKNHRRRCRVHPFAFNQYHGLD